MCICHGSVTALPLVRQTLSKGATALAWWPRVAWSSRPCINWQGSHYGGEHDVTHETRLADGLGRHDIRCGNHDRLAVRTQRGRSEPLWPAENGAARGGVQIQRQDRKSTRLNSSH